MKSPAGHTQMASGAWLHLTLVEQLAHVGSEVERAIRAHQSGRDQRRDHAIDRALELFDLIGADERWRGARRRETRRAREEFCSLFFGTGGGPRYAIRPNAEMRDHGMRPGDGASLQKYFLQFAVAARQSIG